MGPRLLALALIALSSPASALDASLYTRHRVYGESLPEAVIFGRQPLVRTSSASAKELAYQLQLVAALEGRPAPWLGLRASLDTGLLSFGTSGVLGDGLPLGEHAKETLFLGETYAELQLGEGGFVLLRAGKTIAQVGNGAVFDGYALGLELDLDGGYRDEPTPLFLRAGAHLVDATFTAHGKASPLFDLELGGRIADTVELALFGALFIDGASDLSPIVRNAFFAPRPLALCNVLRVRGVITGPCAIEDLAVTTSGSLAWIGARGAWRDGEKSSLTGTTVLGLGGVRAKFPPDRRGRNPTADVSFLTMLATLDGRFRATEWLELGAYAVAASGDAGFEELGLTQTYHGFVGLSPRLPFTSIFFGGGLATTLQSPTVSSVSPNGSGLIAAGLELGLLPSERSSARLGGSLMAATDGSATGSLYGGEIELRAEVELAGIWSLFASGSLFIPGTYYGAAALGGQAIAGAALVLGD